MGRHDRRHGEEREQSDADQEIGGLIWAEAGMAKNVAIAALVAVCGFMAATIVKVENQRYALTIGLCRDKTTPALTDLKCLAT